LGRQEEFNRRARGEINRERRYVITVIFADRYDPVRTERIDDRRERLDGGCELPRSFLPGRDWTGRLRANKGQSRPSRKQ
jgi:hypothetical protein